MPDSAKPDSKREWVNAKSLTPGPVRRDSLTEEQTARLRRIHDTFSEVDGFTFEQRLDGFKRDMNPDQEIDVWERMAGAYERFCGTRQLSAEEKKDVYGLLLMRTMTSEEETLRRSGTEMSDQKRSDQGHPRGANDRSRVGQDRLRQSRERAKCDSSPIGSPPESAFDHSGESFTSS